MIGEVLLLEPRFVFGSLQCQCSPCLRVCFWDLTHSLNILCFYVSEDTLGMQDGEHVRVHLDSQEHKGMHNRWIVASLYYESARVIPTVFLQEELLREYIHY